MSPPSEEPSWLPRMAVEAAHADQVREHGGQLGLRDAGLLDSALARPRQRWSHDPDADLADLAAAYGFGLVKNHPFVDGNKRIAFVAMNMFLILNGSEIDAPEPEVVRVMLDAHYVATRYPSGHAEGAPFEHYGRLQSDEAIRHAGEIIEFVRSQMA